MQKNRAEFKKKNPELAFGALSKKMGEEWKKLDEAGKKEYEDLSNQDKERFRNEMKTFKPPPQSSSSEGSSEDEPPKKKRKAKKEKRSKCTKESSKCVHVLLQRYTPSGCKRQPRFAEEGS